MGYAPRLWAILALIAGSSAIFVAAGTGSGIQLITHTLFVQQELDRLSQSAQEIETGHLGYIATSNERYIATYAGAKSRAYVHLDALQALVNDNSEQAALVSSLKPLLRSHLTVADDNIAAVQSGRDAMARASLANRQTERVMDELRNLIARVRAQEDGLYAVRDVAYQRRRVLLALALLASIFGTAGLAYTLYRVDRARRAEMVHSNQELAHAASVLEHRVAERTLELAKERDRAEALLRDVTHRIGNMLNLVVGFLNLHIRHASEPAVVQTLTEARTRVYAIASAQRRMNVAHDLELVRIDQLIAGVMEDLSDAQSSQNVRIVVDIAPLYVAANVATTLCVLTQEFAVNALKHAFPNGRRGTIEISLAEMPVAGAVLTVTDNGIGQTRARSEADEQPAGGLGSKITERLVRQFDGVIHIASANQSIGTMVVAKLPALAVTRAAASVEPDP